MSNKTVHYTVAELIKELEQFPQDLPVLVNGYEDGFENIVKLERIKFEHKADSPYWSGEFQETEQQNTKNSMEAIVLRREIRDA